MSGVYCRVESGGQVASGLIDNYALPVKDSVNHLSENDIVRLLGVEIPLATAAEYLSRLEFRCRLSDDGTTLEVTTPSPVGYSGEGVIGKADVLEEIARLFGYEQIPTTRMADELPPAYVNRMVSFEEKLRDELASAVASGSCKLSFYFSRTGSESCLVSLRKNM